MVKDYNDTIYSNLNRSGKELMVKSAMYTVSEHHSITAFTKVHIMVINFFFVW